MKKSIGILMVALLATGMSLTAQNRGNGAPEGKGAKMGKPGMGMMKELNLTEDQKAKLQVMHQGFAVQDSVSKVQFKKQRESVKAERQLALAKILTPEQLLQLDKIRVEKGQKAGKKGQVGPGNGKQGFRQGGFAGQGRGPMVNPEVRIKHQVERMTKQLDLTPEQASKIQDIQTKHFKKDIAKFHKFEKQRAAQFKKNHGNIEEIKAVLTPEQVKKLDALKEQAPRMGRPNGQMNMRN